MQEIARVTLANEMDLILAHKRSMKLAELAGLSLAAQTSFATAVSEVSRNAIEGGKSGCLILQVEHDQRDKYIVACVVDEEGENKSQEGLAYAKRLVDKYNISTNDTKTSIELFYSVSPSLRFDIHKLDDWRRQFRNDPAISPYEELKRKNEQLQELSEKVQKSEAQYKLLTNALPLIIFSSDLEGRLLYANEWLTKFTGETVDSLNENKWRQVIHEEDYNAFSLLLKTHLASGVTAIKTQARLKNKKGNNYLWHQISLSPFKNDKEELQYWIGFVVDIHAQKVVEETLHDNFELKQTQQQLKDNQHTLEKYIDELNRSNNELQQFAFVASHDLQEPVRKVIFYCSFLLDRYKGSVDEKGIDYMKKMLSASERMRSLIHDILTFSQINKEETKYKPVDLNKVASEILNDFDVVIEEKGVALHVDTLPKIVGDARMMRQLFSNLISNSIKYSKPGVAPVIDISAVEKQGSVEIAFCDNGIGFDEQFLPKMFTLFQRLHTKETYEGTGLGLAICQKIVDVHGGHIWATATEGEGATFFVSLPIYEPAD